MEPTEEPRCVADDVPDELLRLILLRLDCPLWLFRAACVCKRWRNIVDGDDRGRAFLRLASSLHPPAVIGHYQNKVGGGRQFVPSSSPPAPIIDRRFSLDFIPENLVFNGSSSTLVDNWEVADCHGGLVLLREGSGFVPDLIICDPLSRQWRRIHHPLGQGFRRSAGFAASYYLANVFLMDGDDGMISISSFRVLYWSDADECRGSHQLYVFSLADGGDSGYWRFVRRTRRSELDDGLGCVAGRVDGSLYLGLKTGALTVLDKDKLEFYKADLPTIHRNVCSTYAIVHGTSAGTDPDSPLPPVVFLVRVHGETVELFRQVCGSGEWVLEHSIPKLFTATTGLLGYPDGKRFRWQKVEVIAGGTGLAILSAWVTERATRMTRTWLLSFNVDTMELQTVTNEPGNCGKTMTSYTVPWPRFLRARRPLLKPKSTSFIKANRTMFQIPRARY